MTWLYDFDLWFAAGANGVLRSVGVALTPVLKAITLLGDGGLIFILVAASFLLFKKTRKAGVTASIAIILGAIMTNLILKNLVARPRPFADTGSLFYEFWAQAGCLPEDGYSFPSGHTTAAAALAMAMFLSFRKRYSWTSFFIPVLYGFTRIYFCVHFASDVFAGLIIGSVGGLLAVLIRRALLRTRSFDRFMNADGLVEVCRRKKAAREECRAEKK